MMEETDRLWLTDLYLYFQHTLNSMPYFSHKVVPHAQLWRNELLPVCGSLCGHRRRGGRGVLYRAPRNQHPHVEPTSVSIHILCWGLRGSHWGRTGETKWYRSNMNSDTVSGAAHCSRQQFCMTDDKLKLSIILKAKEEDQGEVNCIHTLFRAE